MGPSTSYRLRGGPRIRVSARDGDRSRAVLEVSWNPGPLVGGDTAAIQLRPTERRATWPEKKVTGSDGD